MSQVLMFKQQPASDPVQEVFAHWVFMLGKNPKVCALGESRRKAIRKALALYDIETIMLAIEGCASSPFHNGENDRHTSYNDLTLILRDEQHVEKFAEMGEALREKAARRQAAASTEPSVVVDAEELKATREKLKAMAARSRVRRAL